MTAEMHKTMGAPARAEPQVAITLDVDWAPDFAIELAAAALVQANVRATWFLTHDSPAVQRLRDHASLFELGWHPNFFPGSTHGATEEEVFAHCRQLAPDARVVRTHGLLQSTRLLDRMRGGTDIRIDASLLLRGHPHLAVHDLPLTSGCMQRVPFWWEDDIEMSAADPVWALANSFADGVPGLRVLNFHPIHIALDSQSPAPYETLKEHVASLAHASAADVAAAQATDRLSHNGPVGTARAFGEAIGWIAARGGGHTMSQLVAQRESQP
jgi:hypothetical protein